MVGTESDMKPPLSVAGAVAALRADPQHAALIHDSYLDEDAVAAAQRFAASAEFAAVLALIGTQRLRGRRVLDLGAGRGMATLALARNGAAQVLAVDPDGAAQVGLGTLAQLTGELPIHSIRAFGEHLPLASGTIDLIYARQVLHHTSDLAATFAECRRVLAPGGMFIACREHVADDDTQLQTFLAHHPVHQLAGGEHAFPLATYRSAMVNAGFRRIRILGPWDSIINAFPEARSHADLVSLRRSRIAARIGRTPALFARCLGLEPLLWRRLVRDWPGRLVTMHGEV